MNRADVARRGTPVRVAGGTWPGAQTGDSARRQGTRSDTAVDPAAGGRFERPAAPAAPVEAGATKRRCRGWVVRRALVAADLLGIALAFALAEAVFGAGGAQGPIHRLPEIA